MRRSAFCRHRQARRESQRGLTANLQRYTAEERQAAQKSLSASRNRPTLIEGSKRPEHQVDSAADENELCSCSYITNHSRLVSLSVPHFAGRLNNKIYFLLSFVNVFEICPYLLNKAIISYTKDMKIIFAQGNPGTQYALTRHNVGFIFADTLAKKWGIDFTRKAKFQADIAEVTITGEKILIVKPITFYNDTGISARSIIDFYKIDPGRDFLVIHDEIALPFGTFRTRDKGRDAGNNGVKSLNAHIGETHKRIRVGIYQPLRDRMHDADFVLGTFTKNEQTALPALFAQVERFVGGFIDGQFPLTKVTVPHGEDKTDS